MKKCQIHGCNEKATECIKKGTIKNGIATKKDMWHCEDHKEKCENELNQKSISVQMVNPMQDAKSVIKIKPKKNK